MDKNIYHISSVMKSYLEELDYKFRSEDEVLGLSTGIKALDECINGICEGDVILAASTVVNGLGTDFAMNSAYNVACQFLNNNKYVLYLSLSFRKKEIIRRIVSMCANIKHLYAHNICCYEQFEEVANTSKKINNLPLYICDEYGVGYSIETLEQVILENLNLDNKDLGFIVIDHLECIGYKIEDYTSVIRKLKDIAKHYNIPILIISRRFFSDPFHLKEVRQYIRDFSAIDKLLLLKYEWYDLYYKEPKKRKNETEDHFKKRQIKWEDECKKIEYECDITIVSTDKCSGDWCFCYYDRWTNTLADKCPSGKEDIPF